MVKVRCQKIHAKSCTLIFCFNTGKSSLFADVSLCSAFHPQLQPNDFFRRRSSQSIRNENVLLAQRSDNFSQSPLYPWTVANAEESCVFHSKQPYYVFHPSHPTQSEIWQELCPPAPKLLDSISSIFSPQSSTNKLAPISSLDVSETWSPEDDPHHVARSIIHQCLRCSHQNERREGLHGEKDLTASLIDSLVESLHAYRDFCRSHILQRQSIDLKAETFDDCSCCTSKNPQEIKLKCRLVATRGNPGAKCPLYHIDDVPCRWIQAMVGPGVELVDTTNVNEYNRGVIRWDAFNYPRTRIDDAETIDEDNNDTISWSVEDRNRMLVDVSLAHIYHTNEGEAILIPGSTWDKYSMSRSTTSTKPVVHKSPEGLHSNQCRVLFTQDIIFE